jgi:predicted nucleotidyltransferase/uncharacterized protein (UPF0332 family)/DNA-binding HxlR family transcriptional regulator
MALGTTLDILGSKVTIRTLRNLLRRPYQERFFKELVKEVGVGVGPLSSTLRALVVQGVVEEATIGKQHFYKANLQNSLTKALYDLFSVERKLDIPSNLRAALDEFVSKLRSQSKENLLSVILFGSVATGTAKAGSDLDLLTVFNNIAAMPEGMHSQTELLNKFYRVTVQEHSFGRNDFLEAYQQGDDIIVNALAEGLVLYDNGFIMPLLSKPLPRPSASVAQQDLEEARKKIEDAKRNYRNESLDTTIMLLALAMSFGVRAYLIAKGEIPGSRHNLAMQMRKHSSANAKLLENLTAARNAAAHGIVHFDKDTVWKMLRECEDFVRQAFEETNRRL